MGATFIFIAVGSVIATVLMLLQLFASVIVTTYVPAVKPEIAEEVLPLLQLYVYAGAPPLIVELALPLLPPLQVTPVSGNAFAVPPPVFATATEVVAVQPLASVIVTVYVPADKFNAVCPVPPAGNHV